MESIAVSATYVAAACAITRSSQVFVGLYRMVKQRRDRVRWHVSMIVALPEPFLIFVGSCWFALSIQSTRAPMGLAASFGGAALSAAGLALFIWSLASYRGVGTGHYVDPEHKLCTHGAYAYVRHPLYLAAILQWFGVGVAFRSAPTIATALIYVVPAYALYASSEERMMVETFGRAYDDYRKKVPMLVPLRRA